VTGAKPHIFTIPAGTPFLPTLADAVLTGEFGPVPGLAENPLALADVTILVPTRRGARALAEAFVDRSPGMAVLPRIRPIGDVDEAEHLLAPDAGDAFDRLALPPAMSRLERQLTLARLVRVWGDTVRREIMMLGDREPLLIPASAGDAMRLAGDLAGLLDEMESAGVPWDALKTLTPEEHPGYWTITLEFLRIVTESWPKHLAERGLADPVARRDALLRAEAARLTANPPAAPVIAAGSTGSLPATAELLRAVASLPLGAVVLPGLDQELDDVGWAAIGTESDGPVPSHPQYGLKLLLSRLGADRADVVPLAGARASHRARLIGAAMRPAETTDLWAEMSAEPPALDGLGLLVAANEQEEALAIAIALREGIEQGVTRAALVTPDRTIARRVSAELRRFFKHDIDDSAGASLRDTPPAILARLVADAVLSDADPVTLLAIAKHPLARFGMKADECRRAARALELALFRNPRLKGGMANLTAELAAQRAADEAIRAKGGRIPKSRRRLGPPEWDGAARLVQRMTTALLPLEEARAREVSTADATRHLITALRHITRDEGGDDSAFWSRGEGEALAELLTGLVDPAAETLPMMLAEYPGFLAAVMEDVRVPQPPASDPRIHIWGTLEARLQSVDLMILAGLDEGIWPAGTRTDPWLSRTMRAQIGLEAPERRIGLSAHDFAQAMSSPRVIVTRAERRGGTPTVPSRWLQRLGAVAGEAAMKEIAARGARYLAIARRIDGHAVGDHRVKRPEPKPPLSNRPRNLSITEIETWVRDPYAIYARRVLELEPLDAIGQEPDARQRGNLIHEALGTFAEEWRGPFDAAAEARLKVLAAEGLASVAHFPEVHAIWRLRFDAITRWFIGFEAERAHAVAARFAEISGRMEITAGGGPFVLRGRADRIDVRRDGSVDIFDFKTGTPPSSKQVLLGFAPQLGLEVAMARAGAFDADLAKKGSDAIAGRRVTNLAWLGLRLVRRDDPYKSAIERGRSADEVGAEVFEKLRTLIAAYDDPERGYRSLARPQFERQRYPGDYDHLARVAEWRLSPGEDDV
jgi:ATP-dependent helicase/nuclease subunit B